MRTASLRSIPVYQASSFVSCGGHCKHEWVANASDLGLKPGVFPRTFNCFGFGNGLPFYLSHRRADGSRLYKQDKGCAELVILND